MGIQMKPPTNDHNACERQSLENYSSSQDLSRTISVWKENTHHHTLVSCSMNANNIQKQKHFIPNSRPEDMPHYEKWAGAAALPTR